MEHEGRLLLAAGLAASLASHILRADDMFTRINTGPGAVPNGSSAAAWGDFNNDGWLDLFITSFGGTTYNYCYTNNGDGTFTRVLPTFFPANNINSFGCAGPTTTTTATSIWSRGSAIPSAAP